MPTVWLNSRSPTHTKTLKRHLLELGYSVRIEPGSPTDLAIFDCGRPNNYPTAPIIPTLALVRGGSEKELAGLLLLGYRGYLLDYRDQGALRKALESVARGELWASRRVTGLALGRLFSKQGVVCTEDARLVALARQGLTNREIASAVGLSENRVKWRLSSSYKRLGIRGRRDLQDLEG